MSSGGATDWEFAQDVLRNEGVVVIKSPLVDDALRKQVRDAVKQHFRESPEFKNANPDDPAWKPVLGGFAALGNPSSFHHPTIRKLREMFTATVLESDVLPLDGKMLEKPFDRLLYRIAGETPSAESMHRDEAATAVDGDVIWGGWANLDDTDQFFSCAPGTHLEVSGKNRGFAKIKSKEEQSFYRQLFRKVRIPPGCILVFYERLVHEVLAIKSSSLTLRMMLGWRATMQNQPLFGSEVTTDWIANQAVPRIKSGQNPPVWPSAYSNFSRNFPVLTKWSMRTFVDECLYTATVGSGEFRGTQWVRVKSNMLSLKDYGLPMHPSYDMDEIKLLMPQYEWKLYTFDSPNKRIGFKAVTPDEWNSHLASQHAAPLGRSVRRPKPGRVD